MNPHVVYDLSVRFLGIAFRGGLQIRSNEPEKSGIDNSDDPRVSVIANAAAAAFRDIFCHSESGAMIFCNPNLRTQIK